MPLTDHPMWRRPQHHLDVEHEHNHVHWVELFYDLVHVVTIFLLGNYLSDHLNPLGFMQFTLMFIALWFAWSEINVYNALYVSTDVIHRLTMAALIITVMFMAAAIPSIIGKGWPFFALAYAANRFLIGFLYFRAKRVDSTSKSMAGEMTRNMWGFAILFAISAFLPAPYSYGLFLFGLAFNQLVYSIRPISIMRHERFQPNIDHFTERFALMTLIVLGEAFFKLVLTLSEKGIYKVEYDVLINFIMGGFTTFVMCWIYFDFVGNAKSVLITMSRSVVYWLAHMLLMLCAVMVGVALAAEVKVGFWEPYPYGYAVVGCLGLAGYILSLGLIQMTIDHRMAHDFTGWGIKLFGIGMALLTLLVVPYTNTLIGNTLYGIALFSQIIVPLRRAARHILSHEG